MTEVSPIAFIDLKAQQARIRPEIDARVKAVLDHGQYINGPEVTELEKALAEWTGAEDVVLVGNGTEALEIAIMGEGIGYGDAVFIPAFTYNATASAVMMSHATPVFVDVDAKSFNMDPADLEAKIEEVLKEGRLKPRMVVPVDLFGTPADYPAIEAVARKYDLAIMADGAQSFGGKQDGKWVGNIAPITATSFFPAKALGCYGDGGAIFSDSKERADVWRSIRWHGTDDVRKESIRPGTNGRMDSMQAAIVLVKLSIFGDELKRRHEIAKIYNDILGSVLELPTMPANTESGYGLYSITVNNRDHVQDALNSKRIPSAIYYQKPLHQMKAFEHFAPNGGLPVCEALSKTILSLPMHPYMTDEQATLVAETVVGSL